MASFDDYAALVEQYINAMNGDAAFTLEGNFEGEAPVMSPEDRAAYLAQRLDKLKSLTDLMNSNPGRGVVSDSVRRVDRDIVNETYPSPLTPHNDPKYQMAESGQLVDHQGGDRYDLGEPDEEATDLILQGILSRPRPEIPSEVDQIFKNPMGRRSM